MENLTLKPGGLLERTAYVHDTLTDTNVMVTMDVSDRASAFLFEAVTFEGDIRLNDIFRLLNIDPILSEVFKRYRVGEFSVQAQPSSAQPRIDDCTSIGLEYLELSQCTEYDPSQKVNRSVLQIDLHGIGNLLEEPVLVDGSQYFLMGKRIRGTVTDLPPKALLNLPLMLNKKILCEMRRHGDPDSLAVDVSEGNSVIFTLGQVLDCVLRDLLYFGSQKTREANNTQTATEPCQPA